MTKLNLHNIKTANNILTRKNVIPLVIILTLSFALKLVFLIFVTVSNPNLFLEIDSEGYNNPALALAKTGVFAISPDFPHIPEVIRTPGYPLFLAGIYTLFGENNYPMVILAQILLSLGIIILTYCIVFTLYNDRLALLAILVLLLDLTSLSYSLILLSETLFTFLIVGMLLIGVHGLKSTSIQKWALFAGFFLALATIVRPISYYLIIPLVLGVLVFAWKQKLMWKVLLKSSLLLFLPFIVLIGGWQMRNVYQTGSTEFSGIVGINMLFYRGAGIIALRDGISLQEAQNKVSVDTYYNMRQEALYHPDKKYFDMWKQDGIKIIQEYPHLFIRSQVRGIFRMMFGTGHFALLKFLGIPVGPQGPLEDFTILSWDEYLQKWTNGTSAVIFWSAIWGLIYLCIIYAGILSWIWHNLITQIRITPPDILIWGVLLYLGVIAAGPEASDRFRMPIMPILIIYGVKGLEQFYSNLSHALSRKFCR